MTGKGQLRQTDWPIDSPQSITNCRLCLSGDWPWLIAHSRWAAATNCANISTTLFRQCLLCRSKSLVQQVRLPLRHTMQRRALWVLKWARRKWGEYLLVCSNGNSRWWWWWSLCVWILKRSSWPLLFKVLRFGARIEKSITSGAQIICQHQQFTANLIKGYRSSSSVLLLLLLNYTSHQSGDKQQQQKMEAKVILVGQSWNKTGNSRDRWSPKTITVKVFAQQQFQRGNGVNKTALNTGQWALTRHYTAHLSVCGNLCTHAK